MEESTEKKNCKRSRNRFLTYNFIIHQIWMNKPVIIETSSFARVIQIVWTLIPEIYHIFFS